MGKLRSGHLSRAMSTMLQDELVSLSDGGLQRLRALHPPAPESRPIPDLPGVAPVVCDPVALRAVLKLLGPLAGLVTFFLC